MLLTVLAVTVSGKPDTWDEELDKRLLSIFGDDKKNIVQPAQNLVNDIKRPTDIFKTSNAVQNLLDNDKTVIDGLQEFSANFFKVRFYKLYI